MSIARPLLAIVVLVAILMSGIRTARADDDDDHVADAAEDLGDDDAPAARRRLVAIERREPAVAEVVAAALRHAGLATRGAPGWARRARWSALLPLLTLRAARGHDWDRDATRSTATTGFDEAVDVTLEARASWRLDRLAYSPEELRAASLDQRRVQARAELTTQVTTLYYRRRAAQLDALTRPPTTVAGELRARLGRDELTAQLDGLTGGWLSAELARRRP